ncbi:hypothetical protein GGR56DRAFT_133133 [Xylariaceae sp. FL0804]|nr:hypothetical protein GGR56DRAFT_133133 [Xylariaceae sp. FL0804]
MMFVKDHGQEVGRPTRHWLCSRGLSTKTRNSCRGRARPLRPGRFVHGRKSRSRCGIGGCGIAQGVYEVYPWLCSRVPPTLFPSSHCMFILCHPSSLVTSSACFPDCCSLSLIDIIAPRYSRDAISLSLSLSLLPPFLPLFHCEDIQEGRLKRVGRLVCGVGERRFGWLGWLGLEEWTCVPALFYFLFTSYLSFGSCGHAHLRRLCSGSSLSYGPFCTCLLNPKWRWEIYRVEIWINEAA